MTELSDEKFCRYCFEDDSVAKLISPCDCRGSAAFIHKRCALKWMLVSDNKVCELCSTKFRCKPSRWSTFKKSLQGSKHEALCYAIVFAIFMAPVILFKSIADALRYNSVLTYEQADRLLTGGLFGTYLLLIVFGVLIVAIWVHKCHDDPLADAEVAPLNERRAVGDEGSSESAESDATADDMRMTMTSSENGVIEVAENDVVVSADSSTVDSSDSGVVVVIGDPRSPGETRRATALAAAAIAAPTRPNTPSSAPNTPPLSSVTPNCPSFIVGASPSVTLAAIVFHHQRENRNERDAVIDDSQTQQREATSVTMPDDEIITIENGGQSEPSSFHPSTTEEIATVKTASSSDQTAPFISLSQTTSSSQSVLSQVTPSRATPVQATPSQATPSRATSSRPPVPTCFSCEIEIDADSVYTRQAIALLGIS